jgi:hypothetical protein
VAVVALKSRPDNAGLDPAQGAVDRRNRVPLTAVAWQPPEEMPLSEWIEQGRKLGLMGRSAGWWVGDWLNYGNAAYGERYARAARITGYDVGTLMNMTWVASRFEPSRRRESLSWSHHAEVAALPPEDQDRVLARAEAERLSVRDLRDEVRRERRAAKALHDADATAIAPAPESDARSSADFVCPECGHSFVPEEKRRARLKLAAG